MSKGGESVNVLMVCTGNICRSPFAEAVLSQLSKQNIAQSGLAVSSAGTYAESKLPIHELSEKSLVELGFQSIKHQSRQLDVAMIEEAQLILTATSEHRGFVAQLVPGASQKTFNLLEYARIAEYLASEDRASLGSEAIGLKEKIALASVYRGYAPPAQTEENLNDPWGHDYSEYLKVGNQIRDAVTTITDWWRL